MINGAESGSETTVAATIASSDMRSGIYLGITGFNSELYEYPIQILTENTKEGYEGFVNSLSMADGTLLYYSVDEALNALQKTELPADLSNVAIVTFTDGLDQGSMMKNVPYEDDMAYLDALNSRIMNETVLGHSIKAFSIGLRGSNVTDIDLFKANLTKLASQPENATEVANMAEVNAKFQEIAESLSKTNYIQTINLKIPGLSNGTRVRFTFDNVSSADKSQLYIEGKFNLKERSLEDVKYVGLTSTSGTVVKGTVEGIFVTFRFEGVQTEDNELIKSENTDEWTYIVSRDIWQINSEFDKTDNSDIVTKRSSAVIMLALDCSSSLAGDFVKVQTNAKDFINTLLEHSVNPNEVTSVSLDKSELMLAVNQTASLKATVLPSTALLKGVTWTSTNSTVATVSANGEVTAHSLGNTTIVATTQDGGFTATCNVNVIVPVSNIELNVNTIDMNAGETSALSLTITPSNADYKQVVWSSSDANVASVDADGNVVAKSFGMATITATTTDGSNLTASCSVYVSTTGHGYINGCEYVDLGLPSKIKWATCNIGAIKQTYFGNKFAWGEVNSKTNYTESNYTLSGVSLGDIKGNPKYDVARAKWGGTWRLPTKAEVEELINKCTWEYDWSTGIGGFTVTGPNGRKIFLPRGNGSSFESIWCSTPDTAVPLAYSLKYGGTYNKYYLESTHRWFGLYVRAVSE